MKALPQAALVLVPAQESLGIFVIQFNEDAAMHQFDHALARGAGRQVGPAQLVAPGAVGQFALGDEPADGAW